MEKEIGTEHGGNQIYEVGFLIVPTVLEERVGEVVSNIKGILEKNAGIVIADDFPKMKTLAYLMTKPSGGTIKKFNSAYFGWIKFEISAKAVGIVEKAFKADQNILRFLLIKTVRENTLFTKHTYPKVEFDKTPRSLEKPSTKEPSDVPAMTIEELDKTIEELVVE